MIIDPALDRFPMFARRGSWTGGFWVGLRTALSGAGQDAELTATWAEQLVPRAQDDTVTRAMTFCTRC